jgi:fatty acid desaturase
MNLRRKLRGKGAGIAIRASILALFLIVGSMNILGGIWNYTSILCWVLADNALVSSVAF